MLACVSPCVYERPREHYKTYCGFCDPSGGSSDSFTLAIGHKDLASKVLIVDALREVRPPFNPSEVVAEFSQLLLKGYGVSKVYGDRYAGEWPKEQFGRHGVRYEQSAKPKSDLYIDLLAAINSKRVALLDHARLLSQLCGLERRVSRAGKDSIDHAPGAHDDLANCVAGLVAATLSKHGGYTLEPFQVGYIDADAPARADAPAQQADPDGAQEWHQMRLHNYLTQFGAYGFGPPWGQV